MKVNKLKIFSFFAGVGFLDLGFEKAGYEIKYVNEYVPSFLKAYKHARVKMNIQEPEYGYHEGDIKELLTPKQSKRLKSLISEAKKDGLVGFIAGPPCPDFSVGGKNKGRKGERGQLSQTYINLIISQKPDFFLFENVKGLWRTKKHRKFYDELKQQLKSNGYLLSDKLVNSIEYAVPQDRDRIILIGFNKYFIKDLGKNNNGETHLSFPWERNVIHDKDKVFSLQWPGTDKYGESIERPKPENIIDELTVEHWFRNNKVEDHPNSQHAFTPRAGLAKFKTIEEGDVSKKSYKRLHRWRYSPTAAYGNNEVHVHPYYPRRISAAEALSIQSLPKDFVLPEDMTLTDMFKTIGNGVPFLLSYAIANTIKDYFNDKNEKTNS